MRNNDPESVRERRLAANADDRSRVLLVDDDLAFLSTTEAILAEHIEVVSCTSGEQALRMLPSRQFHLVCSDFKMSGINGADFLDRVAALPYFVSTLLMTGSDQYIRGSRTSSQHYVILKPFEPTRLIGLVLQLARLARMKRSVRSLKDSVDPAVEPAAVAPLPSEPNRGSAPASSSSRRKRR
jgi:DNA-binding NtrC family response regulator